MMKHKKFSSAILCGFKKVDGRQHFGDYCPSDEDPHDPTSVCVLGARNLCLTGSAKNAAGMVHHQRAFYEAWGLYPDDLNDGDGAMPSMPWEHIYGMARAAGL
jgi:hypothetical protein